MRIITCASYFATGSSAVTDFFGEFDDIVSLGRYEYRFLQDPDGVSDLEFHIVENNHRHNTSEAIKRFIKMTHKFSSFGYGGGYKVFGDKFTEITNKYISEITELKAKSWWHRDRLDKGELFCIIDRMYSLIKRVIRGGLHNEKKYSLLSKTEYGYYSSITEEEFLNATRKYVDAFVSCLNKYNAEFVMVDQMVPPTNCNRYARYFNDVKIIVVDRDPRDVYLWEKDRIQWGVIPTATVQEYVKWFKITRKYSNPSDEDHSKILRIKFEDMIYHYDETCEKLCQFVGVDINENRHRKTNFIPEVSINNTNLKTKIKGYEKEIEYIEKELSEYLYDFGS